MSGQEDP